MTDLIDRQAAIDALCEEPVMWLEDDEYGQGLNNQWHWDVNALKKVPSAHRWIPVTELVPKNWSNILISDGDAVMEAFYVDGKFTGTCIYRGGEANVMEVSGVLAWMPLPEPYKPTEEETT